MIIVSIMGTAIQSPMLAMLRVCFVIISTAHMYVQGVFDYNSIIRTAKELLIAGLKQLGLTNCRPVLMSAYLVSPPYAFDCRFKQLNLHFFKTVLL